MRAADRDLEFVKAQDPCLASQIPGDLAQTVSVLSQLDLVSI